MAKATVTCTCCECGKSFTASKILASRDQANNWEEWAKSNIIQCDECRAKSREEEKAAANAKAAEAAKEFALPELTGSDKQVAWATELRNKFIVAATEAAQSKIGNDPIESKDMADFAGYIVLKRTSASDWIDSISKEFAVLKYSEMSKCIEWRRENKEWYNR